MLHTHCNQIKLHFISQKRKSFVQRCMGVKHSRNDNSTENTESKEIKTIYMSNDTSEELYVVDLHLIMLKGHRTNKTRWLLGVGEICFSEFGWTGPLISVKLVQHSFLEENNGFLSLLVNGGHNLCNSVSLY